MSSPNPFADSNDPSSVPPIRGADDPGNPYASPQVPCEQIAEPVSLYRDGNLLVAHRDAGFPPICIRTNEPAQRAFRVRLQWSYFIDIHYRTVVFHVGLCESCIRRHRRRIILGWIMCGCSVLLMFLMAGGWRNAPALGGLMVLICPILLAVGIFLAGRPPAPLAVKRVKWPYFWVRGVHPGFLDPLPHWISRE